MSEHPLKAYRVEAAITLNALARRVGCSGASLSRIEAGLQQPSPSLCRTIEASTGIPKWKLRPDLWDAPETNGRAA